MDSHNLLAHLRLLGVQVWAEAGQLRYRAPKGTLSPELLAQLSAQREMLLAILDVDMAEQPVHLLIKMSYGQRALWFLNQGWPDSSAYNVSVALTLRGALSVPALQRAVRRLGNWHPLLRAKVEDQGEGPALRVDPRRRLELAVVEAATWKPGVLHAHVQSEAARPLALKERVCRLLLYRVSGQEAVLHLCWHHIVVDGWSVGLLLRDLATLYTGEQAGQSVEARTTRAAYADFVAWQKRVVHDLDPTTRGTAQRDYWLGRLAAPLPRLELPTDLPRPAVRSERGGEVPVTIDTVLTRQLRALATEQETTMFAVLLAGFSALLHRYTNQEDILIGTPYHGRSQSRFERVVGYLVNTLVVRVRAQRDMSFRSLLRTVHERSREALLHADYPFALLVEELHLPPDPGYTPVCQAMFTFQNFAEQALRGLLSDRTDVPMPIEFGPVTAFPLPLAQQNGQHDLSWLAVDGDDRILGKLSYATDLFERETVVRMAAHLTTLLASAATAPDLPLHELSILPEVERRRLVCEWNQTASPIVSGAIPARLTAQAQQRPDALAIVHGTERLTYRELEARANRLARHLRTLGVRQNLRVGLCLESGADQLIALCAILKAGGAYVPLDPEYPIDRLLYMIKDAAAPILISRQRLVSLLPVEQVRLILVDEDAATIAQYSAEALPDEAQPEDLAYIIYTSGSTGQPRGAQIEHRSVLNLWAAARDELFAPRPDGAPLQLAMFASLSFDASVLSWLQLLSGHTVHILPTKVRQSSHLLVRYCREHAIDVLESRPSLLPLLIAEGLMEGPWPQRLWFGGEAVSAAVWQALLKAPAVASYNAYGPTECTVAVTVCRVIPSRPRPVIGRPLCNTRIYILDPSGQPAPIGVPGELYIGGLAVGRGYLNQPEETGRRFLADSFSDTPGARMYRTGDIARFLADGDIEYIGRRDDQVKLRGYRIELGEIESALRRHPEVRDCVVALRYDRGAEPCLVGYVVANTDLDIGLDKSLLRRHLGKSLPDFMIPSVFMQLTALPLTPSGKIDRKLLPVPAAESVADSAPGTPTEEFLASLWCQLLGLPSVGRQDNFFTLGGSSLLAMQMVAHIRRDLEIAVPLQSLLLSPQLATFAEKVDAARGHGEPPREDSPAAQTVAQPGMAPPPPASSPAPTQDAPGALALDSLRIELRAGTKPALFLVHPIGGQVICYARLAPKLPAAQAVVGIQAQAALSLAAATLEELAALYVQALRAYQPAGPYKLGGWSFGGIVAYEMARQLQSAGQPVEPLILLDSWLPSLIPPLPREDAAIHQWLLQEYRAMYGAQPEQKVSPSLPIGSALAATPATDQPAEDGLGELIRIFKRHSELLADYRPLPYAGRTVLLCSEESAASATADIRSAWQSLCQLPMEISLLPGSHYSILVKEAGLSMVAELLGRALSRETSP